MRKNGGRSGAKGPGRRSGGVSKQPGAGKPMPVKNAADESTRELVESIIDGRAQARAEVDSEFLLDFLLETREHLEKIQIDVLALESDPTNTDLIHGLFREFHTIKGLAGFVDQDLIRELAHQTETQLDQCRKGQALVDKNLIDLILLASDHIKMICDNLALNDDPAFVESVIGQMALLQRSLGAESTAGGAGADPEATGIGRAVDKEQDGKAPRAREERAGLSRTAARREEEIARPRPPEKAPGKIANEGGYIRVPSHKLDNLGDMIGELLIAQSQIEREAIGRFGPNDPIVTSLLRMEKLSKGIQDLAMSLRMVSLRSVFLKINRIGRDTADGLGKDVDLQITGEETEIDRDVAERILDPLVHLVRNSITHGIESADERSARGKPERGLITIQAYGRRGSVYIVVADDGRGIDTARVRGKAEEKGLLDPGKTYGDDEILRLIFAPGFTTAEKVDQNSGRGVGLDVVKTEVSRIGGKVEVENRPGEGCIFTLKIPINLAAINGTIVEMLGGSYIIPTLYIRRIVKPDPGQWVSVAGERALIRVKDGLVPLLDPARIFGVDGGDPAQEGDVTLVILELEREYRALPVRGIIDRREIVVKPLGSEFSHLAYAAGASILGDGRVSLILDVENLFKIGEAV